MLRDDRRTIIFAMILCFTLAWGTKCVAQRQTTIVDQIGIALPLNDKSEQILYRKGYTTSYNEDFKIPNWVAWHLTKEHATGIVSRPGNA